MKAKTQEEDGDEENAIEERWNVIEKTLKGTADQIMGFRERGRNEWMSEESWKLIEEGRVLKGGLNDIEGGEQKRLL